MGATFSRVKTWVSTEDVVFSDLNAEFDNILTNLTAAGVDDFSANVSQMQTTVDPGEVGTESLATSVAGELSRLRHLINEITGENEWYESPGTSLISLSNAIGSGLTDNRIVSGRVRTTSAQPTFLVPNGAARTVTVKGATTNFIYFVEGTQYTISTDINLTNLTAAPSSNNTCLINDALAAADPLYTKFTGENGSDIVVDTMGSEISALVGKFAAFKLAGASTEYFIAFVESTTKLTRAFRGHFFDSTDAVIPRSAYTDNDVITLMKLTWVFANTAGALTATYNNPIWADDEPSSPAIGDYWFDYSVNKWKVYGVGSYADADAHLIGICFQDVTNTVGARSYEFFKNYDDVNTVELIYTSATVVRSRQPHQTCNVWGTDIRNDRNIHSWDITLHRDSGVSESASTHYYFYLTETGDTVISDVRPYNRTEDLRGHYHPFHSWRCVGRAFNNSSSDLTEVESYFRQSDASRITAIAATVVLDPREKVTTLSGASYTVNLPPAANHRGEEFIFIHEGTSLTQVYTLDGFGSETVGGSTTVALYTNKELLKILSDGTNWRISSHYATTAPLAYTPTLAGFGTPSGASFLWTRTGSYMSVIGYFGTGTVTGDGATCTLPSGTTVNATELPNLTIIGTAHNGAPSVNTMSMVHANTPVSSTVVFFSQWVVSAANNPLVTGLGNQCAGTGQGFSMRFACSITGWLP